MLHQNCHSPNYSEKSSQSDKSKTTLLWKRTPCWNFIIREKVDGSWRGKRLSPRGFLCVCGHRCPWLYLLIFLSWYRWFSFVGRQRKSETKTTRRRCRLAPPSLGAAFPLKEDVSVRFGLISMKFRRPPARRAGPLAYLIQLLLSFPDRIESFAAPRRRGLNTRVC